MNLPPHIRFTYQQRPDGTYIGYSSIGNAVEGATELECSRKMQDEIRAMMPVREKLQNAQPPVKKRS